MGCDCRVLRITEAAGTQCNFCGLETTIRARHPRTRARKTIRKEEAQQLAGDEVEEEEEEENILEQVVQQTQQSRYQSKLE